MTKQKEKYLDLMPKQEELQNLNTGFEMNLGDADSNLEGIQSMELEIFKLDF